MSTPPFDERKYRDSFSKKPELPKPTAEESVARLNDLKKWLGDTHFQAVVVVQAAELITALSAELARAKAELDDLKAGVRVILPVNIAHAKVMLLLGHNFIDGTKPK